MPCAPNFGSAAQVENDLAHSHGGHRSGCGKIIVAGHDHHLGAFGNDFGGRGRPDGRIGLRVADHQLQLASEHAALGVDVLDGDLRAAAPAEESHGESRPV